MIGTAAVVRFWLGDRRRRGQEVATPSMGRYRNIKTTSGRLGGNI